MSLDSKQIQPLIRLLDDQDSGVAQRIRERLLALGDPVIPYLEAACQGENRVLRRRSQELLADLHPLRLKEKFRQLGRIPAGENLDLEQGACLIMEFGHPGKADPGRVRKILDRLAAELSPRLNPDHGPSATVGKLSQFLFHDQGFRGNQESYFDPENSFLDSVLESKQGIPITLSILCLLLGRRLGLPLVGVGLPCHFIVKFEDPENPVYFDPFNEGRILTRKGCSDLVRSFGLNFETRFLVPATPRETLIRMLHNLTMIYNRTHEDAKARQLTEYSQILLRRG